MGEASLAFGLLVGFCFLMLPNLGWFQSIIAEELAGHSSRCLVVTLIGGIGVIPIKE